MTRYMACDRTAVLTAFVGPALFMAGFIVAIARHTPMRGLWIFLAMIVAWCAGSWYRLLRRWRYSQSISYYTTQGVRMRLGSFGAWMPSGAVEVLVDKAIAFGEKIGNVAPSDFDGATVTVVKPPLKDRTGRRCYALTSGRDVWIECDSSTTVADLLDRTKHELGHVALNAIGITDESEAHQAMLAGGYGL